MAFTPKTWHDWPATDTPVNAAALVDMESRLGTYVDSSVSTPIRAPVDGGTP